VGYVTMAWVPIIAVVLLGFARILLGTAEWPEVNLEKAVKAAECSVLKPEIKAGTALTLFGLPSDPNANASPVNTLEFRTLGPVQVQMPTIELDKALQNAASDFDLPAMSTLVLMKSQGSFEFRLHGGAKAEVREPKARFFLETDEAVRFGPTQDARYSVLFQNAVTLEVKQQENTRKQGFLPAGATGSLSIGKGQGLSNGQDVILLEPVTAAPWAFQVSPSLAPVRTAGQSGLASLSIDAAKPGLGFNASGFDLSACASSDGQTWKPVGVKIIDPRVGAATLLLTLPEDLRPSLSGLQNPWTNLELIVASSDGQFVAYGGFTALGCIWASMIAFVFTGALFWWLANLRHEQRRDRLGIRSEDEKKKWKKEWGQWFAGLFVGGDNDPSLSLFQMFFWTVITVWGLIYVFAITGNLLSLTQQMLWLLGIAGAGSIAARWIAGTTPSGSTSRAPDLSPAAAAPAAAASPLEFWQILNTNGRFDLLKLQIFVFTLMIGVYVVWRIADAGVFPTLDANTLLLLGVSQSVYIGGKVAGTTSLARAQTLKDDSDRKTGELQGLQDEKTKLTQKQEELKAKTPPEELSDSEKKHFKELPELISAKQTEVDNSKAEYEKALKELGLKPA
jgi:hypothetical protein